MGAFSDLGSISEALHSIRSAKYLAVSSYACLLWSHITTFEEEVEYIWRSKFSPMTGFFLLIRYFAPFTFSIHLAALLHPSPSFHFCEWAPIWSAWSCLVIMAVSDCVLALRVWALFGKGPKTGIALFVLLFSSILPSFVLGGVWIRGLVTFENPFASVVAGCAVMHKEMTTYWEVFVSSLIISSLLCALTLYKVWTSHRAEIRTPLLTFFVRDGTFYYFVVFFAMLFTGFGVFVKPFAIPAFASNFIVPVLTITCCQLQLSLRGLLLASSHETATGRMDNNNNLVVLRESSRNYQLATFRSFRSGHHTVDHALGLDAPHPWALEGIPQGEVVQIEVVCPADPEMGDDKNADERGRLALGETRAGVWEERQPGWRPH